MTEPSTPPVFDFEQFDEATAGDIEFQHEILAEYLAEVPAILARLEAARRNGNVAATQLEAHSLKGSSLALGAAALGAAALDLEKGATDSASLEFRLDRVREEFARVEDTLRQHLNRAA